MENANAPPRTAKRMFEELQSQTQSFWKAWSDNCLHEMMNRKKWRQEQQNIKRGQLVLLKNENLPPTFWAMGRVVEVREAEDGKVRQALIKTQNSMLERSITKLCVLPTDVDLNHWVEK